MADKYEVRGISAGEGNFRTGTAPTLKAAREMARCATQAASYYAYALDGTAKPQYLGGAR